MDDKEIVDPIDIDENDRNDAFAVTEYIEDIMAFYKNAEITCYIPSDYDQLRGILIDNVVEVHNDNALMHETLYLTVNLIDRFLAVRLLDLGEIDLIGATAMFIAAKYEEKRDGYSKLYQISGTTYPLEQVAKMELLMLDTLKFDLWHPTPYVFMRRFLKVAQSYEKLEHMSFFILELSLVSYEMLRFQPSLLAAASIFTAKWTLNNRDEWSRTCVAHTGYKSDDLMECARLMVTLHKNAEEGELTSVYYKYATIKFLKVSKMEAAVSLEAP